jgi:citrate/tricarballylate utilization protein
MPQNIQQLMQPVMRITNTIQEAERALTICNACRYCEGHCAVFQAMELRTEFNADNLDYLANLCHNCGSCFHHCQYAEPHEFNVNIPAAMAELRQENYAVYTWPAFMGRVFSNNGLWMTLLSVFMITAFIGFTAAGGDKFVAVPVNSFYGVISHESLVAVFGGVSVFVAIALIASSVRFWRVMKLPGPFGVEIGRILRAVGDVLTLKYLDGGNGQGCSYPAERPSLARRRFHHLTFYGFLLCFAATSVGTLYHYVFEWPAPYGHTSLPKVLGILGGFGLLLGPAGLLWLKSEAEEVPKGKTNKGMDVSFLVLLFLASLTGLVLMVIKNTPWVAAGLSIHLGVVLTLFLAMPYGKFIHGFYRLIALIAFAVEKNDQKPLV